MIEAIRLLSKVRFDAGATVRADAATADLNLDLGALGYTAGADLMAAFATLDDGRALEVRARLLDDLREIRGADAPHAPMFTDFPHTQKARDVLHRSILLRVEDILDGRDEKSRDGELLSCGHWIDVVEMRRQGYSGCPVCGTHHADLAGEAPARAPLSSVTPLKILGHLSVEGLADAATAMLARQSSLSEDERALVAKADFSLVRLPEQPYREVLPLILAHAPEASANHLVRTATDVLRYAVYLSDPKGDLSLAAPVRFRLKTARRRELLRLLSTIADPREDMLRHRERWLRLASMLRIHDQRSIRIAHGACMALAMLQKEPEAIPSFNRDVEQAVRARRIDSGLIELLSSRPGEFARRIDLMLRSANDPRPVIEALPSVLTSVPTRLLFEIDAHLRYRARGELRVFHPKGQQNRIHVVEDRRQKIDAADMKAVRGLIDDEIQSRLRRLPPIGRVRASEALRGIPVPWNRRGDSKVSEAVAKGARVPFVGDTQRLFVHWTGMVDVDLSIILWNKDLEKVGQIAFTDLSGYGCVHSGDVLSAPNGASEYIDFKVSSLLAQGIRYVSSSLISYSGRSFEEFPCFAGFMQRDHAGSGELYEPTSVRHRFDVSIKGNSAMPLMFDLKTREVIFADMSLGGRAGQSVRGQVDKNKAALRAMLDTPIRKPNLMDLVAANVRARGAWAAPEDADAVEFGPDDQETILRDLGYGAADEASRS
jgi:hypothetical protein